MPKKKKTEKRQPRPRPGLCVVCPEPARGHNYGAITCNSCKTFFRRAIVEKKVTVGCTKNGRCETDRTLKPCRACRFVRCIEQGMQPSLVNPAQRLAQAEGTPPDHPASAGDSSPDENEFYVNEEMRSVASPVLVESKIEKRIQMLLGIEEAHHALRLSDYFPMIDRTLRLKDYVQGPSKLGNHYGVKHPHPGAPSYDEFNPVERIVKTGKIVDLSSFPFRTRKLWFYHDILYSVEFLKAIPVYWLLDDVSKHSLVDSALACSTLTSAFYSYSQNADRTVNPDGSTYKWTSEERDMAPNSVRKHTDIVAAMREVGMDRREYVLLKMILACNHMLDGLSEADIFLLENERVIYSKLLLSYCLAMRGVVKGPAAFARILAIIDLLTQIISEEKAQHILATGLGLYPNPTALSVAIFHSR